MKKNHIILTGIVLGLLVLGGLIKQGTFNKFWQSGPKEGSFIPASELGIEQVLALDGEWRGSWKQTMSKERGEVMMGFEALENGGVALTLDIDGKFLGESDLEQRIWTGNVRPQGIEWIVQDDPSYGDVTVFIDSFGNINLLALNVPMEDVNALRIKGRVFSEDINLQATTVRESDIITNFTLKKEKPRDESAIE